MIHVYPAYETTDIHTFLIRNCRHRRDLIFNASIVFFLEVDAAFVTRLFSLYLPHFYPPHQLFFCSQRSVFCVNGLFTPSVQSGTLNSYNLKLAVIPVPSAGFGNEMAAIFGGTRNIYNRVSIFRLSWAVRFFSNEGRHYYRKSVGTTPQLRGLKIFDRFEKVYELETVSLPCRKQIFVVTIQICSYSANKNGTLIMIKKMARV